MPKLKYTEGPTQAKGKRRKPIKKYKLGKVKEFLAPEVETNCTGTDRSKHRDKY